MVFITDKWPLEGPNYTQKVIFILCMIEDYSGAVNKVSSPIISIVSKVWVREKLFISLDRFAFEGLLLN